MHPTTFEVRQVQITCSNLVTGTTVIEMKNSLRVPLEAGVKQTVLMPDGPLHPEKVINVFASNFIQKFDVSRVVSLRYE
jgi:hypothetical protein